MQHIIQIAGIRDQQEAEMLVACGVDWLGFPLRLAVHREDLGEAEAARIIKSLRPPHEGVLITYLHKAGEIAALCHSLGTRKVQLHGDITRDQLRLVKTLDPGLFVIKSLVVRGNNHAELESEVRLSGPHVDAFITDTYDPETGACGATGKTHDWKVSRRLVQISPRPVILAGGLRAENVARAIGEVQPAAVDAHTGVEGADGRKDLRLVQAFVAQARAAFADLSS
ncbi:MAG TPA: phosphoribosylanthranilate isomerase [Candidatus Binatia bacterium]|nr:phosphoribosylanthranilate isomerase [Candidatus Binatia bacterium]